MNNPPNILVVIPARGGSKGIPRKNIRALNGNPLIYYSIKTALNSSYKPTVIVSSDDDEILEIAKKIGSNIIKRDSALAEDKTTLDSVIYDAYCKAKKQYNKVFNIIVTLQPTSPLLKTKSLDSAIKIMLNNSNLDSIISAKNDTHLSWGKNNNTYFPKYKKRVNRQYLEPSYKETGGFFITNSKIITKEDRIGTNVELFLLTGGEEIDIDTFEDWNLCEYYLKRKTILFVTSGYSEIGLGHIYRTINIANDILNHNLMFLTDKKSKNGYEKIKSLNYNVSIQKKENILDDISEINPDVVINDILNTSVEYMKGLKGKCNKVINFEDCGKGAKYADIVINALYPEEKALKNKNYFGHKYFIARDEFIFSKQKTVNKEVKRILITFGGTDPNNFTLKVLNTIYSNCIKENITIDVIAGLGYSEFNTLKKFNNINVKQNVKNISTYMENADLIFSSAGRTVYEIAMIGTPSIILCQNKRETTHLFASKKNGFVNLGEGYNVTEKELFETFSSLLDNFPNRKKNNAKMLKTDLKKGRKKTIKIISDFINN